MLNGAFSQAIDEIREELDGLLPKENIRVWEAPGPLSGEVPAVTDDAAPAAGSHEPAGPPAAAPAEERRGRKSRRRKGFEGLPAGELTVVAPPGPDVQHVPSRRRHQLQHLGRERRLPLTQLRERVAHERRLSKPTVVQRQIQAFGQNRKMQTRPDP